MNDIKLKENTTVGEKYYYIKHKSGLDIYVVPKKFTSNYAIFSTKYGSADNCFKLEGDKDFISVPPGIAHYLEHKMFESEDGTDTFARFAKNGAHVNAFTSNEMTAYLFDGMDEFDENLESLLDFVSKPYFTPENVEKERGIIGQEIRMCEDNPMRAIHYNLLDALYETNPVKINTAGTVESIAEITPELLYSCYRTFYNLSNMMLVAVGDITPEQVIKVADKVLPVQEEKKIIRFYGTEKRTVNKSRVTAQFDIAAPMIYLGIKTPEIPTDPMKRLKRKMEVSTLFDLMFGSTSEFALDVYQSGLVRGFDAVYTLDHMYGMGVLRGESPEPEKVWEKFISYTEEKKKTGFSREDFDRIKRVQYAGSIKMCDFVHNIAFAFTMLKHDDSDIFDCIEAEKEVKFEDMLPLANEIFREEYYAMSVVEPKKK